MRLYVLLRSLLSFTLMNFPDLCEEGPPLRKPRPVPRCHVYARPQVSSFVGQELPATDTLIRPERLNIQHGADGTINKVWHG